MTLPPTPITLPPASPIPHGLYAAATIQRLNPPRHHGGVEAISPNHGAAGVWPNGEHNTTKQGHRPVNTMHPAVTVWATDECLTVGTTEEETVNRALHTLTLREPALVEKQFTTRLIAKHPPAGDPVDPVGAVAALEAALAEAGYLGVLHAYTALLPVMEKNAMVKRVGGSLFTPGGHRWAFGTGYTPLGQAVMCTDPVTIVQAEPTTTTSFEATANTWRAVVESTTVVVHDTPITAVTVA